MKVMLTIAPIILWYPGFLGFMYMNSYLVPKLAQKVEYRIPNGFKGQVMVIFPVECGQVFEKKMEERSLIFLRMASFTIKGT